MPSKDQIKQYIRGAYYHTYNRGVEKRNIFLEESDFERFLYKLERCASKSHRHRVKILAYCLMPNHFHILLQSTTQNGMESFYRSLLTSYSLYFNKKYKRVGYLFQGNYKANMIRTDYELLYKSRYIHQNPLDPKDGPNSILRYPYSTYKYYASGLGPSWINTNDILNLFSTNPTKSASEYQKFVRMDPDFD